MSFLEKGYKVPTDTNYLNKLPQGETNFRVLSSAIVGYEYWTQDNKPVRSREIFKKRPADVKIEKDGTWKQHHFWAFVVWHYEDSRVKIMEVTQKTIMNPIKSYVDNVKWGDPKDYDITIVREGDGLKTEYAVMPNPKSELELKIAVEVSKKKVNLEALFSGEDPFEESEEAETVDTHESTMTQEEQNELLSGIEVE